MKYTLDTEFRGGFRRPISTALWGPVIWDTLHYISLGYPVDNPTPEVQQAALDVFKALPFLLPCLLCRVHLAETYETDMPLTPEIFQSQEALGNYIVALRDLVKRKHACPSCPPRVHTFAHDVELRLLSPPKNKHWYFLFLLVVPLLTVPFFYRKSKNQNGQ